MPDTPDTDLANRRNELLALFRIANTKKSSWLDPIEAYTVRHGETPRDTGIDVDVVTLDEIEAAAMPNSGFAEWLRVYRRQLKLKPPPDKCPRCHSVGFLEQTAPPPHHRKLVCGICGRWLYWVSRVRDIDLQTYRPKA